MSAKASDARPASDATTSGPSAAGRNASGPSTASGAPDAVAASETIAVVPPSWGRKLAVPLVLSVVTFAALSLYADLGELRKGLAAFDYWSVAIAFALSFGSFVIRAARFQMYLRSIGVRVPHVEATLVFFAGMIMTVTPGKLGEVFKSFLLKWSRDVPLSVTTPILITERVSDLVALLLLAGWGAWVLPGGAWIALGCVALAVGALALTTSRRLGDLCVNVAQRVPRLRQKGAHLRVLLQAQLDMNRAKPLALGLAASVAAWSLQVLSLKWIVLGLPGADIALQPAAFAYSAPLIAGIVALLPGGVGVTEAGMAGALSLNGGAWATPAATVAVTLLTRVVTLWFAIAVGAAALVLHRRMTGWRLKPAPGAKPGAS